MGVQESKASPYEIGKTQFESTGLLKFTVSDAIRNTDQQEFSIFQIKPDSEMSTELANNFVRSWKVFRHPNIAQFIESYEENGEFFVVTERLVPFEPEKLSDDELSWALYSLVNFVCFMGEKSSVIHGNLTKESIFLTEGNEIKVVGLQWVSSNGNGPIYKYREEWEKILPFKSSEFSLEIPYSVDCRFIGEYVKDWSNRLPKQISKLCRSWVMQKRGKLTLPSTFLDDEYWKNDKFVQYINFLNELAIKDNLERDMFLKNFTDNLSKFGENTQTVSILPKLISSLSFSPTPSLLVSILSIGKKLESKKFARIIIPNILGLFENKDRALRIHLLSELDSIVPFLDKAVANDQIFANIVSGLLDPMPHMKQATIMAMVPLAPLLNINNMKSLIRELRGLQSDPDPQIRTNALVCVAKIAKHIDPEIRQTSLVQVFGKAAKDKFWDTRKHSISAFLMCATEFSDKIIAYAVIPSISPLCVDENADVKEKALYALQIFLDKLKGIEKSNDEKPQQKRIIQSNESNIKEKVVEQQKPAINKGVKKPVKVVQPQKKNQESIKEKKTFDEAPIKTIPIKKPIVQENKPVTVTVRQSDNLFDDENDGWDAFEEEEAEEPVVQKEIKISVPKKKSIPIKPVQPKVVVPKKEEKVVDDDVDGWSDFDDNIEEVNDNKKNDDNKTEVKENNEDVDGWDDFDEDIIDSKKFD